MRRNRKTRISKYNKVFGFVDWENSDETLAHKYCNGTFFKDSCLNLQPLLLRKKVQLVKVIFLSQINLQAYKVDSISLQY